MPSLTDLRNVRLAWFARREQIRADRENRLSEEGDRDRNRARRRDTTWRTDGRHHAEVWEVAYDVQQEALGLKDIATVTIAEALLPYEEWTARDVIWALGSLPDGSEQSWMAGNTNAEVRLTRRLGPWRGLPGPHTAYTERVKREQEELHERRTLRRTLDEIERAQAVPMPDEVRDQLAELRAQRRAKPVSRRNVV